MGLPEDLWGHESCGKTQALPGNSGPSGQPRWRQLGQDHLEGKGCVHNLELKPPSLTLDGTSSPTASWEVAGTAGPSRAARG